MFSNFAITSQFARPTFLLSSAIATRVLIGVARIGVENPYADFKHPLTQREKWRGFLERCFIEGVGIPIHFLMTYMSQDPIGNVLERFFLKPPTLEKNAFGLAESQVKPLNDAIKAVYLHGGKEYPRGVISQQIFKDLRPGKLYDKFSELKNLVEKLSPAAKDGVMQHILNFEHKVNWFGAGTLFAGVVIGAVLSGYVLQWVNDKFVSPKILPWVMDTLGIPKDPEKKSPAKPVESAVQPSPEPIAAAYPYSPVVYPAMPYWYPQDAYNPNHYGGATQW